MAGWLLGLGHSLLVALVELTLELTLEGTKSSAIRLKYRVLISPEYQ